MKYRLQNRLQVTTNDFLGDAVGEANGSSKDGYQVPKHLPLGRACDSSAVIVAPLGKNTTIFFVLHKMPCFAIRWKYHDCACSEYIIRPPDRAPLLRRNR
jgi:hypothetical protein